VAPARVALFGVGTVGSALLRRLDRLRATSPAIAALTLIGVANSRQLALATRGLAPADALARLAASEPAVEPEALLEALGEHGVRIAIDASACDALASRHADWLARGVHVVTACKLGQGAALSRWRAIRGAGERHGTRYGDAASVGAGLPLLRSIRALRAGGDRVHAIAGTLSGSLAWLLAQYDGTRPFSALVREARAQGYTEPDPRDDLSGEDVRRKLLILARAAGVELESEAVRTESLVPDALALLPARSALDALELIDAPLRARFLAAHRAGRRLRHVARLDADGARVGLEALAPSDPLAQGEGCDNRVVLWSDRYRDRPLVIQGPGAGADVTAAALLDDVLEIAARAA
jgi:homoserine dehydrogenase